MESRDLRKIKRKELLELLLRQKIRIEELETELEDVKKKLDDKNIKIDESGSIAEAALKLNGIFEVAQKSIDDYVDNVKKKYAKMEKEIAKKEKKKTTKMVTKKSTKKIEGKKKNLKGE